MSNNLKQRKNTATTSESSSSKNKPIHSHSHSHSHSHHRDEEISSLGSKVTLIGLCANVLLTLSKGTAGILLKNTVLLADSIHSASDLIADLVTLVSYTIARKPVDKLYPHGYGKYESIGSLIVSVLLIMTGFGLGLHSYHLLIDNLSDVSSLISPYLLEKLQLLPKGHSHGADEVDARAMWFAAISMLVKEYLYRITIKVAAVEKSNVLMANAMHHRSDAFGSLVALAAIGGSWLGYPILDPLGGLFVSGMILMNGVEVGITALKELVDRVSDSTVSERIFQVIAGIRDPSLPPLINLDVFSEDTSAVILSETLSKPNLQILSLESIRIFSSGPSLFVNIHLTLPSATTLAEAGKVEIIVKEACIKELGGAGKIVEVIVRLVGFK